MTLSKAANERFEARISGPCIRPDNHPQNTYGDVPDTRQQSLYFDRLARKRTRQR